MILSSLQTICMEVEVSRGIDGQFGHDLDLVSIQNLETVKQRAILQCVSP